MVARNEMHQRLAFRTTPPLGSGLKHTNSFSPQKPASIQIARRARTSRPFVAYRHDSYTGGCEQPFIAYRGCHVNHRSQAALSHPMRIEIHAISIGCIGCVVVGTWFLLARYPATAPIARTVLRKSAVTRLSVWKSKNPKSLATPGKSVCGVFLSREDCQQTLFCRTFTRILHGACEPVLN